MCLPVFGIDHELDHRVISFTAADMKQRVAQPASGEVFVHLPRVSTMVTMVVCVAAANDADGNGGGGNDGGGCGASGQA